MVTSKAVMEDSLELAVTQGSISIKKEFLAVCGRDDQNRSNMKRLGHAHAIAMAEQNLMMVWMLLNEV